MKRLGLEGTGVLVKTKKFPKQVIARTSHAADRYFEFFALGVPADYNQLQNGDLVGIYKLVSTKRVKRTTELVDEGDQ